MHARLAGTLLTPLERGRHLQGSGPLEWAVRRRTQGISRIPGDTHREAREGADAGALVVGCEEGRASIADREDGVRVANAQIWPILDLHAAVCSVDRLNITTAQPLEKLVGQDLACDWGAIDEVSNNLRIIFLLNKSPCNRR